MNPINFLQLQRLAIQAGYFEKGKTNVGKKVIRDNDIQSGSPDDYKNMSVGEKLAHHFYAAQHHDNVRKNGAKKLAEYATKLGDGHLSQDDYNKLTDQHNKSMKSSHKNFQSHIDTIQQMGGVEGLDETEKIKAGNWINKHYSDEDKKSGFKVNTDKVSKYYEQYGDIHNQKYSKSDSDLYNEIQQQLGEEYDLDDIDAVYQQIKGEDLKIKGHKNPQQLEGLILDKIETLKTKLKFEDDKKMDDEKLDTILRAIIKAVNRKK